MVARNVNSEYFDWLCSIISDSKPKNRSYKTLLRKLNSLEFIAIMLMDENRAVDGVNLRRRFGYECGYENSVIESCFNNNPCSILEMMVALAFYCEEHLMINPANGLQSGRWFWMMIDNLGLRDMFDENYNDEHVNRIILRFINRDYSPDGKGGLIYIPNYIGDMRGVDIWYQLMAYLSIITNNTE